MATWSDEDGRTYGSVENIGYNLSHHENDDRNIFESLRANNNGYAEVDGAYEFMFTKKLQKRERWMRGLLFLLATLSFILAYACWKARSDASFEPLALNELDVYDYIVVGGGPSGILTATKLAKSLENESPPGMVLLLESGTISQASVMDNLNAQDPRRLLQMRGTGPLIWDEQDLSLNKFDIPLLWSGVASSQGRRELMQGTGPETWSAHHWPIAKTLLGRALGGCGLHNAMVYVRSLPNDFALWNLTGWTWDNILPHYLQLETFIDSMWDPPDFWNGDTADDKEWRGNSGPIVTVPAGPVVDSVAPLFVQSMLASGWPLASQGFNEPDAATRVGAGYYEFNIRNGVRDSVAEAMLGKADGIAKIPDNLVIRTGATVSRVLTQDYKGVPKAVGVEYYGESNDEPYHVMLRCSRDWRGNSEEVILAAGAIMTPQVLSNSGIREGGTVADVPGVGKNVQDHPVVAMAFRIIPKLAEEAPSIYTVASEMEDYFLSVEYLQALEQNASATLDQWREHATHLGALGTAGFSAGAFLTSPWAENDSPDIQLTVFPRIIEPHVIRRDRQDEAFHIEDPDLLKSKSMLVTVTLLQPEARYEVRPSELGQSTPISMEVNGGDGNPFWESSNFGLPSLQLPENRSSYLSESDVKRLSWGMEEVRRIRTFQPLKDATRDELYPGEPVTGPALENYIIENNLPNSHWVGSTKMGSADDPMAVVDEELRVRGVTGLRIVDSGVIPRIPNGNTHSTVCVVASRATELILAHRQCMQQSEFQ